MAAARALRRSLCGRSRTRWSFVYACTVVMKPCSIVNASCKHLRHRRDAVRRAGGVGEDAVLRRVVVVVVHSKHERDVRIGGGRRNDDLLRPCRQVRCRLVALREQAGRLDGDVHTEVGPGQLRRVAERELRDPRSVDGDRVVRSLDVAGEGPQHGVVLQEVRHRLRVADVVDGDDLEVAALRATCARRKFRPMRPKPLMPTRRPGHGVSLSRRRVRTSRASLRWTAAFVTRGSHFAASSRNDNPGCFTRSAAISWSSSGSDPNAPRSSSSRTARSCSCAARLVRTRFAWSAFASLLAAARAAPTTACSSMTRAASLAPARASMSATVSAPCANATA